MAAFLPLMATAQYRSEVWCPDNGDGTYTNPVINADYSDPDVCVGGPSGEDYYMTASSFQCTPGLPILHSRDLVNWEIVGYALKELYTGFPELIKHFSTPQHGNGVWAPSIRYHDGEYYIYWGDPDFGVFMVKTRGGDPAGEWEAPVCVIEGKGYIDTCPLWDDDGRCYLVNGWANSRAKFASVLTVRELSADGTKAIGQPVIVFDGNGTENRTCEGPKFYKRDGWYWIMCPAGGVPTGFQLAMRSKSPYGPYEHKIVLAQGKTNINGPHQGGWVHTKFGEDWFLHFQDKEAYGRVVHLQPVDWSSGWPIMGKKGEPVTTYNKPITNNQYPITNNQYPTNEGAQPTVIGYCSTVIVQTVTSGPTSPYPEIMQGFVRIIMAARRYVYLETPYFLPTSSVLYAMKSAAQSGVDVRLLVPARGDTRFIDWASRSYLREAVEAGVKVGLYNAGFLHSKLMVCDDTIATCGSTNIDFRSFENNFESNMFIYDDEFAVRMKDVFLTDEAHSQPLDGMEHRMNPRFMARLCESVARLFSPLL